MSWTPEIAAELEVLCLYNLDSMQEGIKVHSSAGAERVAAAQRLFEKGLISQDDGGYLTSLGLETAAHAQAVLTVLADQ
ncbi:TIGR02647 family protein [Denitrificimonas caeni]|uniref:TIGR02647 family protein n=1 Tax=Denitrificimonas caeni TaxID=521720 RepID=A0AAE9VN91_9GAMM|nr:TIGR02647 family protein [Denitrificimonas caeni]NLJ12833.1 TIGR02647 family protein [Gammaproteobacteria bacterium]WBE25298.1 TIGR02647 family protein [Denitrificimonas caeni]